MEKFKILTLFITIVVSGYALKKLLIKYNFLLNYTGYAHQKFTKNTSVPLSGGLLLLVSLIFIDFSLFNYFIIFALLIFFLGLLGDLSYASSAKIRFIVQFFITLSFVYLNDITIPHIRFLPIDRLLEFKIFNYFFTIACLMVLINGTNFIDGCNTLVVGYYLIIGIILHKLNLLYFIFSDSESIYVFFTFLLSIFVLNFFQKLFLGDSGVYILSFIFGTILIKIYQTNTSISPYFICNLLWYPSFEVLFSIIRKSNFNFSVLKPDTKHLHQLLYFYLCKKILKVKTVLINSLASNVINFFNFCILLYASSDPTDTKLQIFLLVTNVFVYCYAYFGLYKFTFKK